MGKPSKAVMEFMDKHSIDSDEVWQVPDGAWVVKHKALERAAAAAGVTFEVPQIATRDFSNEGVALLVIGKLGDKSEWSFGEASNFNLTRKSEKRPLYPWAMAEKRAKDRVILKLLNQSGALYSEAESEEFEQRQNPHVTRPEDVYDEISDDIKPVDVPRMLVRDSRPAYAALVKEMQRIQDPQELYEWGQIKAPEIHALSGAWPMHFKGEYTRHKQTLTGTP